MFTLNNGNKFPLVGLGLYLIRGKDTIRNVLDAALAAGYRAFDTATVYWNEDEIGEALIELLPKHNLRRNDIYITTKLSPADQGKDKAKKAALKSLEKLKLSYIDLYLIHWPGVEGVDVKSDLNSKLRKESWFDLVDLHKQGILKNIGVSNYTVNHLTELLADCGGVKPVVNQVEYHPMCQQIDLLQFCKKENILLQAYCSLGGAGKTHVLMEHPAIQTVCKRVNKTPAQVLLKWALQHGAAIIPKSANPERIRLNISLDFHLSDEDMELINAIDTTDKFSWEPKTYKKLPKTGKPSDSEWSVISAIVGVFENKEIKVISLGTGSKCIGKSSMSLKGDILNDSHSEIIARRAFCKYLYLQIIQLNTTNSSDVLEKCDENNFCIKKSVKFYFVTGMSPCGDASIMPKTVTSLENVELIGSCLENVSTTKVTNELKREHSHEDLRNKKFRGENLEKREDIHRTGAKCLPDSEIQDPHLSGSLYHNIGAVRTKPGRGDPTLSLSCSDKIARWNAVGWQGALLSLFIEEPIFVEAIICGGNCPFSKESFDRAVNKRIKRENFTPIHQSSLIFPDIKCEGKRPTASSIIWCASNGKETEVSINGRKLGVTKKNFCKRIARTSICKKELFILFQKAVNSLDDQENFLCDKVKLDKRSLGDITYGELKSKAIKYQNTWKIFKEKCFKVWSNKPISLQNFTLKETEEENTVF